MNLKFINNKYTKIYYQIIANSVERYIDCTIYSEKHHILPKSLGGTNSKDNIVLLTAREHFICHWLLTKMTDGLDRNKMTYARWRMVNTKNSRRYKVTSKAYELAKIEFDKINCGRIVSDATRQKQKAPKTDDHKEKLKLYKGEKHHGFGKKRPSHSKLLSGNNNPMKDPAIATKLSGDNHWSKNPKNRLICEHCEKDVDKSNYKMYHGNNCKVKTNA